MTRLEYKGYTGSIEYSKANNYLFGKVLGLKKGVCIAYEGNTATHCKMAMYAEDTGTTINAFIRDSIEKRLEQVL